MELVTEEDMAFGATDAVEEDTVLLSGGFGVLVSRLPNSVSERSMDSPGNMTSRNDMPDGTVNKRACTFIDLVSFCYNDAAPHESGAAPEKASPTPLSLRITAGSLVGLRQVSKVPTVSALLQFLIKKHDRSIYML